MRGGRHSGAQIRLLRMARNYTIVWHTRNDSVFCATSFVNDGEIRRNSKVRVKRNDKVIFDGPILSLKRFKDEVKEVKAGFECGIVLDGFSDFVVDDTMEVYVIEEKKIDYEG